MKARYFLILLAVTSMTIALVGVRLHIVTLGYEIHELEDAERKLRENCNHLTFQINEAKSPQRLEYLAKNKFKMRPAKPNEVVSIASEDSK